MTLEQLRVFVAVAERLHVTRAAQALNLTQSATSAAIRALEAALDTRLFDRVGRHIELTEAGRTLLPEAQAVLGRAARARQALADLSGLGRGHLTLWASQTVGGYWLPPLLARFRAAHPGIVLDLTIGNTSQVARAVASGAADIGFVEGRVDDPALVQIKVDEDALVLAVPPGHVWDGPAGLAPSVFAGQPWVLRERGSGTRQIFEAALLRHGVDPSALDVVLELPSNEAVRAAVRAGAGATVISRLVVAADLSSGALVIAPMDPLPRDFTALWHRERAPSRAQDAMLALVS